MKKTLDLTNGWKLPNGWHEVSWIKGFHILSKADTLTDLDVLSILSEDNDGKQIPLKEWKRQTNLETIDYLISSLTYLKDLPIGKYPEFPRAILDPETGHQADLAWVNYYDRFDLGGCEVQQIEDMKQVWADLNPQTEIEVYELYPKFCAIYLQPMLNPVRDAEGKVSEDGAYDYQLAMMYEKKINDLDFKTVLNMGAFFLQRLIDLHSGSKSAWQKPYSVLKRLRQVLGGWLQRLVSMLP